jgi:non-specific serine/threonine protein kinase
VSSFVGRAWELEEIRRLLDGTRLLTLTGTGGSGKTRLALEVAAGVAIRYPGGAWLVELAGLTDPSLVTETLAGSLGLKEAPHRSPLASVIDRLAPVPALLVLDNCEHLLGACADLATALLRACPRLQVLATSRERLNIAGEITWRVPSLSLLRAAAGAAPAATPSPVQVAQSEAVQLFVERARAVRPGFALTEDNAPWISKICLRLDGIPLALELAAARLASLSVEQVAARLDACFRLLTGGSRTALPRHQTLQATLDWGYQLLTAPEQAALCRLSVFAGGWSLEAAEAVIAGMCTSAVPAANTALPGDHARPRSPGYPVGMGHSVAAGASVAEPIAAEDVLDLLSRLAAKSLVNVTEQGGQARYGLLETVRQYAREHLERSGEAAHWRDLHLVWCLDLAEHTEAAHRGGQQDVWLARLEAEHDNLRAALTWSLVARPPDDQPGAASHGLTLAGVLGRFWLIRSHLSEGRRWLAEALERRPAAPVAARCAALDAAGHLASSQGDYAQAVALHEESLALRRAAGDARGLAMALIGLGNVAREQADYPRAVALYEECLDLLRANNEWDQMGTALNGLANVANEQGDYARAIALYEESLVLARRRGDTAAMSRSLNNLGNVAQQQGDYERAAPFFEQSLALKRELGDRRGIAISLGNLGNVAHLQGDDQRAAALYEDALAIGREIGDKRGTANILTNLAGLACDTGNYERAVRQYGEALNLHLTLGDLRGITWDVDGVAIVAGVRLATGSFDRPDRGQVPDAARVARLFGAADALREMLGSPPPHGEGRSYRRAIAALHSTLDAAAFDAAWTAGKALSMEDAISEALELVAVLAY